MLDSLDRLKQLEADSGRQSLAADDEPRLTASSSKAVYLFLFLLLFL